MLVLRLKVAYWWQRNLELLHERDALHSDAKAPFFRNYRIEKAIDCVHRIRYGWVFMDQPEG